MGPVDFDGLVLGPLFTSFAETVTYTPSGGSPFSPTSGAIFDESHHEVTFKEGVPVSTKHPVLGVRLADFASPPLQRDTVLVRGTSYVVTDVNEDGEGFAKLKLQLVSQ